MRYCACISCVRIRNQVALEARCYSASTWAVQQQNRAGREDLNLCSLGSNGTFSVRGKHVRTKHGSCDCKHALFFQQSLQEKKKSLVMKFSADETVQGHFSHSKAALPEEDVI